MHSADYKAFANG